jgi:long-chain fatty acid transport protein
MFWNSAAAAAAPGINVSTNAALVVPHREIEAKGGAFLLTPTIGLEADSGEIGDPTFVPATYANYQLNERLFLGVGLNSGFGFTTKPDNTDWAGSPIGITSKIFSVNLNPNLAYKLTDTLTVGAGLQVQYVDVRLRSGTDNNILPPPNALEGRETEGDDWGVGATAGVIWKPMTGTSLGVGFRSAIDVELEGTCDGVGATNVSLTGGTAPAGCVTGGEPVTAEFTLPELVSVGLSHQLTDRIRVLGTIEWTNWSRLGTPQVLDTNGNSVDELELEYQDGWFYSVGAEYAYSPDLILRAGVAYEESPITDDTRNVFLPDDERIWLSVGATTKLSERTKVDIGYSHLFIEDSPICQPQPGCNPNGTGADTPSFVGEATGDIDIVTLGITHNFGGPEPELEPLK